jgi:hypothetical protein
MSKEMIDLPDDFLSPSVKKQALDIQFHWVNETGDVAKMTEGLRVQPTVRTCYH